MSNRKILCQVIEGIVYEDRCLYKLSKILEGSKTCEGCILREFEKMKLGKAGRSGMNDINITNDTKVTKVTKVTNGPKGISKRRRRTKPGPKRKSGSVADAPQDPDQPYTVQTLSKLLGKSERRIQELAKEGKIPAHKIGRDWRFKKKEIDHWLSEKGAVSSQCIDNVNTPSEPSDSEDPRPPDQNDEGSPDHGG